MIFTIAVHDHSALNLFTLRLTIATNAGVTRNWLNVLNNGGVPTAFALLYAIEIGCGDWPVDYNDPNLYTRRVATVVVSGESSSS